MDTEQTDGPTEPWSEKQNKKGFTGLPAYPLEDDMFIRKK